MQYYDISGLNKHIVLGDTTTHGGRVISATSQVSYGPYQFAQTGDSVECPHCGGIFSIEKGPVNHSGHELPYAVEGQRTSCGARLVSRSSLALVMGEDGTVRSLFSDFGAIDICEKINKYKSRVTPTGAGGVFSYSGGASPQVSGPSPESQPPAKPQEAVPPKKTALYVDLKNEDSRFDEYLPFKITVEPSGVSGMSLEGKRAFVGEFDPGTYAIIIEPRPPAGEELGPVPLRENRKFKQSTTLIGEQQYLPIVVSRTESILHNIQMTFLVEEPSKKPLYTNIHRLHAHSTFFNNGHLASKYAVEFSLDQNTVYGIMYLEETQGWYDGFVLNNKSIRPMNVNIKYWEKLYTYRGISRDDLFDVDVNFREACFLLHRMDVRAKPHTPKVVATLYNSHKALTHLKYGFQFQEIYDQQLWTNAQTLQVPID